MPDAVTITIIFIVLAALVGAFVRRRKRDKCLTDFQKNMVTLEETNGKTSWGKLRVENTGLELIYPQRHEDKDGHEEASYILYKFEYPKIQALVRYYDELSEAHKKAREKELKRTYHPGPARRLKRRTVNVFKTVRDSVLEVLNVAMTAAKKASPAAGVLTSQDKYVSQMKQELLGSVGTSYEPLLERYIGHKVVLELIKGDRIFEYSGVLKEYTADFVEVMDVDYKLPEEAGRRVDLIVPRNYGVVRHWGE